MNFKFNIHPCIMIKIYNNFPLSTCSPWSRKGAEDQVVQVALDRTQGVRHAKLKLLNALEVGAGGGGGKSVSFLQ